MEGIVTIIDLAKQKINKICKAEWNKNAYIEIEFKENGKMCLWVKLYDLIGFGKEEPILVPMPLITDDDFLPFIEPKTQQEAIISVRKFQRVCIEGMPKSGGTPYRVKEFTINWRNLWLNQDMDTQNWIKNITISRKNASKILGQYYGYSAKKVAGLISRKIENHREKLGI